MSIAVPGAGIEEPEMESSETVALTDADRPTRERSASSSAAGLSDSGWPSKLCFTSAVCASVNSVLLGYDIGVMGGDPSCLLGLSTPPQLHNRQHAPWPLWDGWLGLEKRWLWGVGMRFPFPARVAFRQGHKCADLFYACLVPGAITC